MNDWITVKELAQIQGITPRAIRKSIAQEKYVTRAVEAQNGTKYEIFVPSLNPTLQNLIDFEKYRKKNDKNAEPKMIKTEIYPPHAKKIALARYDLVKLWVDYKNNSNSKTEAGNDFLLLYNKGKMYPEIFKLLKTVSIGTIYRWAKAVKANDDYTSLIPDYNYSDGEYNVNLTREEELVFINLLLSHNKPNIGKATKLTKYTLKKRGFESPSSERNFRRFAQNYQRKHYDVWIFSREGQKALRDKVEPYITRDASKLEVGDVLIADGHRLAIQVINPYTGKPVRPSIVAYQDWKSTALVGYEIMLEENTQCVASALRNAIINLGRIPKINYQDNGKAFKNKLFNGNLEEGGLNGLFASLGIVPVFANPYNARAKTIERFFREFQDSFERLLPSFVGSSIADKPAYMMRNEKFHKEIHNEFIPTIEQLNQMIMYWMDFHYSQPCPNVKGKTIGEVLNESKGEGVDIATLDDLMLAQEIKNIHRNGIRFLKADYYNENLYGLREKVLIKYSLFDLSAIKVFDLKGKFLCEATREMPVHPMANYLGEVKDVEEVKQKIKQQKKLEKQTIKEVTRYLSGENLRLTEWQNPPELVEIKAETQKLISTAKYVPPDTDSHETFEHKYQRYEWLLRQKDLSEEDKIWIKNYEKTNEYEEIYT